MTPKISKREARLERALDKKIRNEEKNVRFASGITSSSKAVRLTWVPDFNKKPRLAYQIDNYKNINFSWCASHADIEGTWSWGEPREWNGEEYSIEIKNQFNSLLNNTWGEIETQTYNGAGEHRKLKNKYQLVETISKEAQDRWINDLDLGQFDQLFRFRRGTNKRIWGVRISHHFFTIWYERNHRICPVENDN